MRGLMENNTPTPGSDMKPDESPASSAAPEPVLPTLTPTTLDPDPPVTAHEPPHPHLPTTHGGGHGLPIHLPFFERFKQRNVGRVAVLYIVIAYLVLEVFEMFHHLLELPPWTGRLVVALALLGLPTAMLFAWVYEVTPQGLKPSAEVDPRHSIARQTGRRLDFAIIALVAVALAYFVADKFWLSKPNTLAGVQTTGATASGAAVAAAPASNKSIAVLPFVDMSEKHDQEYFSDGLSEELIDHLSHNTELKVIARTSSFAFKGKNEDMRTIASNLGVANLLEGSVRKAGLELRITAQLIRASDGVHLWSETYERKLSDVFRVQDEIATTVASALNATLGAGAVAPERPVSIEAHNLYLQGLYFGRRSTIESVRTAEGYLLQALKLDPGYAAAWAELARVYSWDVQFANLSAAEMTEKARAAARTAIKLDSRIAESYTVLAMIASSYDFDWPAADAALHQALAIDPHDADALRGAALVAWAHGDFERTVRLLNEALEYDPLRGETRLNLGGVLYALGRYPEALASLHAAESIAPGEVKVRFFEGLVSMKLGQRAEAAALFAAETGPWYRLAGKAILADVEGRHADADAALAELARDYGDGTAAQLAETYAQRHDLDSAFKWLERGYQTRDSGIRWLKVDPLLAPLRADPRYLPLLRKIRLAES